MTTLCDLKMSMTTHSSTGAAHERGSTMFSDDGNGGTLTMHPSLAASDAYGKATTDYIDIVNYATITINMNSTRVGVDGCVDDREVIIYVYQWSAAPFRFISLLSY